MGRFLMIDSMPANALAAGNSITLFRTADKCTMEASLVDANTSITAFAIELQATGDGRGVADADAKWETINTFTFTTGAGSQLANLFGQEHVVDKPVKRVRFKPITATGGAAADLISARLIVAD